MDGSSLAPVTEWLSRTSTDVSDRARRSRVVGCRPMRWREPRSMCGRCSSPASRSPWGTDCYVAATEWERSVDCCHPARTRPPGSTRWSASSAEPVAVPVTHGHVDHCGVSHRRGDLRCDRPASTPPTGTCRPHPTGGTSRETTRAAPRRELPWAEPDDERELSDREYFIRAAGLTFVVDDTPGTPRDRRPSARRGAPPTPPAGSTQRLEKSARGTSRGHAPADLLSPASTAHRPARG